MKYVWIFTLLALVAVLSACVSVQKSQPPAAGQLVYPAQPQGSATTVEKVVTLAPVGESTATTQPAGPSPNPTIDQKTQETAIAHLRVLLGAPQIELTFQDMQHSPNASNHQAFLYVDQQGNSYYLRPDNLQPIEFTLERPIQDTQGSAKTPEELRAAAEQIAVANCTHFERVKARLVFTEGNKGGGNSFFRWEMPDTDVGGMPAILQIGLRQDGSLFSYLNSLDFLP